MSEQPNDRRPAHDAPQDKNAAIFVLSTMADTTWRMFVPTIGLLLVGVKLDSMYGTKPLLMLAGAAIGAAIASLLIRKQLGSTDN